MRMALQAAIPALKANGSGSVVLFSSVAAGQGFASHGSIAMAKGAVEAFTRSSATDLAPTIRVNCIAPSLVNTELARSLTNNARLVDSIAQLHALGRIGEPDDIASIAAFLLGSDSNWITGQVFGVDGGRSTLRARG